MVTQKLQMCALDENQLLLHHQTSMAMKVPISACVRQNADFEFEFGTSMAAYEIALWCVCTLCPHVYADLAASPLHV